MEVHSGSSMTIKCGGRFWVEEKGGWRGRRRRKKEKRKEGNRGSKLVKDFYLHRRKCQDLICLGILPFFSNDCTRSATGEDVWEISWWHRVPGNDAVVRAGVVTAPHHIPLDGRSFALCCFRLSGPGSVVGWNRATPPLTLQLAVLSVVCTVNAVCVS